jgi:hypothetical protein
MSQPGKRLPQVMNITMAIGFFTFMVAMMFCMSNVDAVIAWALPSAGVYYQA